MRRILLLKSATLNPRVRAMFFWPPPLNQNMATNHPIPNWWRHHPGSLEKFRFSLSHIGYSTWKFFMSLLNPTPDFKTREFATPHPLPKCRALPQHIGCGTKENLSAPHMQTVDRLDVSRIPLPPPHTKERKPLSSYKLSNSLFSILEEI